MFLPFFLVGRVILKCGVNTTSVDMTAKCTIAKMKYTAISHELFSSIAIDFPASIQWMRDAIVFKYSRLCYFGHIAIQSELETKFNSKNI